MARKKSKKAEEESGFSKMLATVVVLGIVFSAGLITGQRLLRAEARAPMVSLSSTRAAPVAADGKSAAKTSLRTTFSFYEHLTGNAEATSPPAPKAEPGEAPEEKAVPAEKPEAKAEVEVPAEPPKKPEVPVEEPAADSTPTPPADKAKPVAQILDEVVSSLSGDDDEAPQAAPDKPAALPARYTLQVSSHPDRESAEHEVGRLTQMGVEPHLVVVNVPGKGQLFRVRVGKFHTMDEARDFQGSVKQRRGVAGFVTPL